MDDIVIKRLRKEDTSSLEKKRDSLNPLRFTTLEGSGAKPLKMFELFKGTGSVGKVANKMGFKVVSLDFDPIYTPDIETDILKWDYKKWAKDNDFYPDYIWSSPPCNTFSVLAYPFHERNTKTAVPKSARAKEGTAILHRTLEIIEYFQNQNPKMLYTIENPRGMMRHDSEMKRLPNRETTLYCLYGDFKRKPTDFWSNFPMGLIPHDTKDDKSENLRNKKCKNLCNLADLPSVEQRYSIPLRLVKKILSTAKESYGKIIPLKGSGFFGDLWDSAKALGSRIVSTGKAIVNVVSGKAPRQNLPPYVRKTLLEMGNKPIVSMRVRRDPLMGAIDFALNLTSAGKWAEAKRKYGYDKFFHLGLEVSVRVSESDALNKQYVIEKNEVIQINDPKPYGAETESMPVAMGGVGHTMNSLLKGSQSIQGDKFYQYDAFQNNCQDFVMSLLQGSGLGNTALFGFIKQPIGEVIAELPSTTGKIARGITDIGGVFDVLLSGEGGAKPRAKFAKQLKKWKIDPTEYLEEARKRAKSMGIPENLLGFSTDDKHKLQIPNPDGKIVKFGSVGMGDYIAYRLSGDTTADKHRAMYLARATKIKGKWKNDEYSPNSLAIAILW
jgi:hypothetical protein